MKVTCNGCFDGLHPGHMFFLGYCLAQGDELVVGINSDIYIMRKKRPKPFYAQEERKQQLLDLGFVSKVVIFGEDNPISFIEAERPHIHCTGAEYIDSCVEAETVMSVGADLVFVPRVGKWASSNAKIDI